MATKAAFDKEPAELTVLGTLPGKRKRACGCRGDGDGNGSSVSQSPKIQGSSDDRDTCVRGITRSCGGKVIVSVFPLAVTVAPSNEAGRGTGTVKVRVITVPPGIVCAVVVEFVNDRNSVPA
jgi:hypothetical protein